MTRYRIRKVDDWWVVYEEVDGPGLVQLSWHRRWESACAFVAWDSQPDSVKEA